MTGTIALQAGQDRRRGVVGYSIGMAALIAWIAGIFPVLRDSDAFTDFIQDFPPEMLALFGIDPATYLTAAGYLSAQFYSLFGPLLVLFFTVPAAAAVTAGEERDGTMDLLLANPVPRRTVVLEKWAAVMGGALLIVAALTVALLALNPVFDLGLPVGSVIITNLGLWLLACTMGAVALAAGAFTGSPGSARAAAGVIAFVAWLVNGFSSLYSWLEAPAAISPFTWYLDGSPLIGSWAPGHGWLALTTVVLSVAAVWLFDRRDLATEMAVLPERAGRRLRRSQTVAPRSTWLLGDVFRKTLWDRRRGVWGWIAGFASLLLVTFAAWPALSQDAEALSALITALPREVFALFGMTDPAALTTPAGFVSSRSYLSIGPILIVIFAVGAVGTSVVREEQDGITDLLLANPLPRRAALLAKTAGIAAATGVVVAALIAVALVGDAAWDTNLEVGNIVAANVGLGLLGLCFAGVALMLWTFDVGRWSATRMTAIVAVATYFLNGLGSLNSVLEPTRRLSPFYWYLGDTPPLAKGFEWSYLLLAVVAALGTWIALRRFDDRDLAV